MMSIEFFKGLALVGFYIAALSWGGIFGLLDRIKRLERK